MHDVALLHEELFGLGAYCLNNRLGQEVLLVECLYALIEINRCWVDKYTLAGASKRYGALLAYRAGQA